MFQLRVVWLNFFVVALLLVFRSWWPVNLAAAATLGTAENSCSLRFSLPAMEGETIEACIHHGARGQYVFSAQLVGRSGLAAGGVRLLYDSERRNEFRLGKFGVSLQRGFDGIVETTDLVVRNGARWATLHITRDVATGTLLSVERHGTPGLLSELNAGEEGELMRALSAYFRQNPEGKVPEQAFSFWNCLSDFLTMYAATAVVVAECFTPPVNYLLCSAAVAAWWVAENQVVDNCGCCFL